jgi:pimeloyl-ACP methyl ester carboxylesterase
VTERRSIQTPTSGSLRYSDHGSGADVIVLHRSIGALASQGLVDELARSNRVLAPAMPGFDDSDRPDWARSPRDLATILIHSLLPLTDRPVLVGLGLGGWVAAEIATLCSAQIGGMVLVSPVGLRPTTGYLTDPFLYSTDHYVELGFASEQRYRETLDADCEFGSPAWKARESNREMTTRIAWKPRLFDLSLPFRLPYAVTPSLVVRGDADRIVPFGEVEAYCSAIPGAKSHEIMSCGHFVELEALDELCTHIRQLS